MSADRHSLVDEVVDAILGRVISGEFAPGSTLPPEPEIAESMNVSRLTTREAMKVLRSQGIVYVKRGIGTFVNPPERWSSLGAVLQAIGREGGTGEIEIKLLEARRIVETGAAELAASRRDEHDLRAMRESILAMQKAHDRLDAEALTAADIAFHNAILAASGNQFIPALLGSLTSLLYTTRRETSAIPEIQSHAIEHHKMLVAAIESGEPERARAAMEAHMQQTYEDYARYLSVVEGSRPTAS